MITRVCAKDRKLENDRAKNRKKRQEKRKKMENTGVTIAINHEHKCGRRWRQ